MTHPEHQNEPEKDALEEAMPPIEEVIEDEEDDDLEDEFSLEKLSEAYADVIKNNPGADSVIESQDDAEPESKATATATEPAKPKPTKPVVDDDAACPVSPESIIESILFVGGPKDVKITSRKIAAVMRDVSPKEVTQHVKALTKKYEDEKRAYRIVSDKGNLRMELHPDMIPVQNHILGRDRATKLNQQAIDVLAIVAYNQPVTREQVDKIRTKSSSSILKQMVKRDLLQIEVIAKPKQQLFRTTERFLDLFGLEDLEDLPQSHDVSDIDELAD